jgi:hypothetical protein
MSFINGLLAMSMSFEAVNPLRSSSQSERLSGKQSHDDPDLEVDMRAGDLVVEES